MKIQVKKVYVPNDQAPFRVIYKIQECIFENSWIKKPTLDEIKAQGKIFIEKYVPTDSGEGWESPEQSLIIT